MRIVVMGGTGHIGQLIVQRLERAAQAVVVASPSTGVDALTGAGLDAAIEHADAVIDVTNAPQPDGPDVREFFTAATSRLLAAERAAGVRHHLMLSIVGADRVSGDGYFAAKAAQELLIAGGGIPYSIVRSTQFFEFARTIADANTVADTIHLPATGVQPVAAEDVAAAITAQALSTPAGVTEIAGPELMTLPQFVGRVLLSGRDERFVVADDDAQTRGFNIASRDLLPAAGAMTGTTTLASWITARTHAGVR